MQEQLQETEAEALRKLADAELAAEVVRRERDQLLQQAQQVGGASAVRCRQDT